MGILEELSFWWNHCSAVYLMLGSAAPMPAFWYKRKEGMLYIAWEWKQKLLKYSRMQTLIFANIHIHEK